MGRLRYLLAAAALLAGCDDGDTPAMIDAAMDAGVVDRGADPDDGIPPDMAPDPDDGVPPEDAGIEDDMAVIDDMAVEPDMAPDMLPPDLGPPVGEVTISRWQTDARFGFDEIYAQAIFAPDLIAENLMNPVGYLLSAGFSSVGIAVGPFALPPTPGSAQDFPALGIDTLSDVATLDAGNALLVGEELVINAHDETVESDGVWLYESLVDEGVYYAEELTGDAFDLYISGGEDVPELRLPAAVRMPAPVVLRGRNTAEIMPIRFGVPIDIEWVPTPDPDDTMVVVAESFFSAFAVHVDDDTGRVDLTEFFAIHDFPPAALTTLSVVRRRVEQVATRSGTIQVTTYARQVLLPEQTGPFTIEPNILDRGAELDLTIAWWDGRLAEDAAIDLGPGVEIHAQSVDFTGQIAHLRVTIADDAPLGPRPIRATTAEDAPLVIEDRLFVADELPMQGVCADAVEEAPLPPGTWRGSLAGLVDSGYNTESCFFNEFTGRDQAIPVQLRAGETLRARLLEQDGLLGMYVIADCADRGPIEDCYVRSAPGEVTEFLHTALEDETVLLILDDEFLERQSDAVQYVLDFEILPRETLLVEPYFAPAGALRTFEVRATTGDFADAPELRFDGMPVDDFERVDPRTLRFEARPEDGPTSRLIPVEARLADGTPVGSAEAVQLVAFRDPPSTCDGADEAPLLLPGVYSSFTDLVEDTFVTPPQCPNDADGPDAVFRVDLEGGQTVRVFVTPDNFDPIVYLLHTCDPAEAVACVDHAGFVGTEYLEWTAGPAPVSVYLVVDGFNFDDQGSFTLEMEVTE